ncbi:cysteine hydrolase family protein [Actinotalea fermentans]|uniref:Isochorismatase n=1 Tax=Actinotalea fermentans TaxID=43671 RepID=A0A511YZX1_9CELL|nr:cysteine hydrolase [Actinotalea fermentans]KGM16978.1 hydrolase [Actinotalea fermentans ATCC 43279 = JCM 9966 = DSM 3133]GEN80713.1 isochorismatase [Actinotalea fermentans]
MNDLAATAATLRPAPSSDPARTVLAVIDMQNVFGEPGSPWLTPRFADVVEPVRQLAEAYGDRAVFTRFVAPDSPQGSWVPYYEEWSFALQPPDAPLWDVVPSLDDAAGPAERAGRVVSATTFSKWSQLRPLVGPHGRLVLCGVSTDCCVISTALAAADDGIEVLVVADACAGVDDDSHAKALHVMSLYAPLVRVVDLAEGLALAREAEHR